MIISSLKELNQTYKRMIQIKNNLQDEIDNKFLPRTNKNSCNTREDIINEWYNQQLNKINKSYE